MLSMFAVLLLCYMRTMASTDVLLEALINHKQ